MGLVADITRLKQQRDEARAELQRLQVRNVELSDKVTWSLRAIDETESHVVCTCGDVSVHISQDDLCFSLATRIKGVWLHTDNPLWPDLLSAMAEAERICRGEDA